MPSRRPHLVAKHFQIFSHALFTGVILIAVAFQTSGLPNPLQDTVRTIVSDDFIKSRPKAKVRRNSGRKSSKAPDMRSSSGRSYRLASYSSPRPAAGIDFTTESQVGLTFWKLRVPKVSDSSVGRPLIHTDAEQDWIAERVEAETAFRKGDYLRLSIESPRSGYLYVIDRDWFRDDNFGETNLIFPLSGDDNRLFAGKLIDIPAQNQAPFRATPKPNQVGEILTIIITSSPLDLRISQRPLSISNAQLMEWEEMWGGMTKRFEMENGAGQVRTRHELQAAARKGTRQLSRDDPPPQTIYVLTTKDRRAVLFNVKLSYSP